MNIAVCSGTFDPVTNGHLDIIKRATSFFDKVIVGVAADNNKNTLFPLEERLRMVEMTTRDMDKVTAKSFSGLLVDFAQREGAKAIVRGLRAVSDFEYEFKMASMNKKLNNEIETVFLMTSSKYSYLSSSVVRQVASLGGCIKGLVPPEIEKILVERYKGMT
ncbi:MAG: pantetheine-phosphate adenylyltransferase [Clostridia bacterium]|nr:pantetheine-phosphate adenylyltransferase [Clostridia bacterium]